MPEESNCHVATPLLCLGDRLSISVSDSEFSRSVPVYFCGGTLKACSSTARAWYSSATHPIDRWLPILHERWYSSEANNRTGGYSVTIKTLISGPCAVCKVRAYSTRTLFSSPTATFGGNWPNGSTSPRPTPPAKKWFAKHFLMLYYSTVLGFELMMVPVLN